MEKRHNLFDIRRQRVQIRKPEMPHRVMRTGKNEDQGAGEKQT
jgi:hypothetical protein